MSSDETLTQYQDTYWLPELFDYGMLGRWRDDGEPELSDATQEKVRDLRPSFNTCPQRLPLL